MGQLGACGSMMPCRSAVEARCQSHEDAMSLQSDGGGISYSKEVPAGRVWICYALYVAGGMSIISDVGRWALSRAHTSDLFGEPSLPSPFTWAEAIPLFAVDGIAWGLLCQVSRIKIEDKFLWAILSSKYKFRRFRSAIVPCLVAISSILQLGNWLIYKVKLAFYSPASELSLHIPLLVLAIFEVVGKVTIFHKWLKLELRLDDLARSRTSSPAPSLYQRFAAQEQKDSRKFELVYIVTETCYVITYIVVRGFAEATSLKGGKCSYSFLCLDSDAVETYFDALTVLFSFLDILAPAGLLLRIYRFQVFQKHDRLGWYDHCAKAFLVFVQAWNAAIAGFLFSDSSTLTFVINNLLSFLCMFVVSWKEALVTVPLAFLAYTLGIAAACYLLEQNILGHAMNALFLALGLSLSVSAKWAIHQSKWEAFQLLEEKSQDVIQQKVLRCKAEFELETTRSTARHLQCPSVDGASEESCLERSAKSFQSAPAAITYLPGLQSIQEFQETQECELPGSAHCNTGDCLPATSLAWVEGEAQPRSVQSLRVGERVLCFDRLAQGLKYAPLVSIRHDIGTADWAKVTLTDGTEVNVTADHPVRTASAMNSPYAGQPRRAGELQPGTDQLLVLKTACVAIASVESYTSDADRVSIALNQPERHAMFMCDPGLARNFHAFAVESVDAFANGVHVSAARTFVHVSSSAGLDLKLPGSSPASLCPSVELTPRSCINPKDLAPSASSGYFGAATPLADKSDAFEGNAAWAQEAATTAASEAGQPAQAWAELSSLGSRFHAQGCKPCAQQNKFQHRAGNPCRNGAACGFCHAYHADIRWIKKARRKELIARGAEGNLPSSSGDDVDPTAVPMSFS